MIILVNVWNDSRSSTAIDISGDVRLVEKCIEMLESVVYECVVVPPFLATLRAEIDHFFS